MEETTIQNSEQGKKSNKEVIGIKHSYNLFESSKENKLFANSLFCVNSKKKIKGRSRITYKQYKLIIKTFFIVYFNEFYFTKKSIYFPFGGYLKKVKYRTWRRLQVDPNDSNSKKVQSSEDSIGMFWYGRPTERMYKKIKIKKLTGSTNQLPKIEKRFVEIYGKDLIPTFIRELSKRITTKTLYTKLCAQD